MFFILKFFKKAIKILNSNATPAQIGAGVILGFFIGISPFWGLHKIIFFLMVLLLNVNMSAAFLSMLGFAVIGLILSPVSHSIGYKLLVETPALKDFWTNLYNTPVIPFTRFNNTAVLGSFILACLLSLPLFIGTKKFVVYYRESLASKVEKWKITKILKMSKIYKIYDAYR